MNGHSVRLHSTPDPVTAHGEPGHAEPGQAKPGQAEPGQEGPPRVLVVDDERTNRELAIAWLKRAGYQTEVANSGEEALERLRTRHPNLILLDMMMPGMDGCTLLEQMQREPELASIPVIFLTAVSDPEARVRGLQLGAADYVVKPYHGAELQARVAAVLRSQQQIQDLRERTRHLEEQSIRDPLTLLYNRRLLGERLVEEVARADRYGLVVSCLMVDIDYFKQVNDILGHAAGDDVLRSVASVVLRAARTTDIVTRYGGEEFAVILPQTAPREAFDVAERIRRRVGEISLGDRAPGRTLTVSIGIAAFPGHGSYDTESLLNSADQALLRAKASGRNRTVMACSLDLPENVDLVDERKPVLIVEDEPNNQALLQKVLSRLGYEWICVGSGIEALEQAANRRFSVILMDLSLPGMDGWEATRRIRGAGNRVPIVATSAHAMSADKARAAEAGCNEYVTKPFNLSELRRVLERYAG